MLQSHTQQIPFMHINNHIIRTLKHAILLSIAAFIYHTSSAQNKTANYLDYYKLINDAEVQLYEKDTSAAINTYLLAFKNFAGFEVDYYTPIELTLTQRKYRASKEFCVNGRY